MEGNYTLFYNKELSVPLRCVRNDFYFRFVFSDVCAALEMDADIVLPTLSKWELGLSPVYMGGEVVDCICIPDEAVYTLCTKSTSANAGVFKKWVAEEVMPRLRGDSATHNLSVIMNQLMCLRGMMERIEDKLNKV